MFSVKNITFNIIRLSLALLTTSLNLSCERDKLKGTYQMPDLITAESLGFNISLHSKGNSNADESLVDDMPVTNNKEIELYIDAPIASHIHLTHEHDCFKEERWIPINSERPIISWTLTGSDGKKTIRARFKGDGFNETQSCFDTSIILDTTNPTIPLNLEHTNCQRMHVDA